MRIVGIHEESGSSCKMSRMLWRHPFGKIGRDQEGRGNESQTILSRVQIKAPGDPQGPWLKLTAIQIGTNL